MSATVEEYHPEVVKMAMAFCAHLHRRNFRRALESHCDLVVTHMGADDCARLIQFLLSSCATPLPKQGVPQ
jgi:hypothetical protein